MRHGKKINHLGRKAAHRKAMLANLACSLIEHKRIKTTLAKGKALRKYVEPMITRSKNDTTHNRRVIFGYLQNKHAINELFGDISSKVADRPGGYTRILKIGHRQGDGAEMCIIELVDYNQDMLNAPTEAKKKTRRGRRKKKEEGTATPPVETTAEEAVEETTDAVENAAEEVVNDATDTVEDAAKDVADAAEDAVDGDKDA